MIRYFEHSTPFLISSPQASIAEETHLYDTAEVEGILLLTFGVETVKCTMHRACQALIYIPWVRRDR